jgi:ribonuclease D
VAAASVPDKVVDPDAYLDLKGAKALDRRGWAVLRELYRAREALALELDRPPFMIISHEALVALAAKRPRQLDEVLSVPGCSARVVARAGQAILEAVARGEAAPEPTLPGRRAPYRPPVQAVVRRRADALRIWRTEAARELALDPGVFFPQRLIERLAAEPPGDLTALEQVEGVRRWRVKLFGSDLLKALAAVG